MGFHDTTHTQMWATKIYTVNCQFPRLFLVPKVLIGYIVQRDVLGCNSNLHLQWTIPQSRGPLSPTMDIHSNKTGAWFQCTSEWKVRSFHSTLPKIQKEWAVSTDTINGKFQLRPLSCETRQLRTQGQGCNWERPSWLDLQGRKPNQTDC